MTSNTLTLLVTFLVFGAPGALFLWWLHRLGKRYLADARLGSLEERDEVEEELLELRGSNERARREKARRDLDYPLTMAAMVMLVPLLTSVIVAYFYNGAWHLQILAGAAGLLIGLLVLAVVRTLWRE